MAIYRRSYLFRLASDPICYLWTGHGPLVTPPDTVDPGGATWKGAAQLLSLPALKALINGVAERVKFSVSGVSPDTLRLALEDRETVRNAELRLGFVDFDPQWQVQSVTWEWLGIADVLVVDSASGEGGKRTRTISLSVASADVLRSTPNLAFWTHADQQKRSPTDLFCNQVAGISAGKTRRFGPK